MARPACLLAIVSYAGGRTHAYISAQTSFVSPYKQTGRSLSGPLPINNAMLFRDNPIRSVRYVTRRPTRLSEGNNEEGEKKGGGGMFDFLNPFETKIPAEMRDEIYKAEGNTAAAKERRTRVTIYAVLTFVLIGIAFFNAFLTEMRSPLSDEDMVSLFDAGLDPASVTDADRGPLTLSEIGYGWVDSNPLTQLLLTTKLGGGAALIGGGVLGTMAELELKTRQDNAEKIWEELERRRSKKGGTAQKKVQPSEPRRSKVRVKSGKQSKRLTALSEVIVEEQEATPPVAEVSAKAGSGDSGGGQVEKKDEETPAEEEGGIVGKLKGMYKQADSMAASQALLLNKKLEDEGILEKITDESGLKVIGKEAASKLKKEDAEKKND